MSHEVTTPIPVIAEHIVKTPDTCGGKPRIAGTRIRVQDIVIWHDQMGMSVEEIVVAYPHLKLSDVYAALAYYHDHHQEIRELLRQEEEFAARMAAEQPSLMERIRARHHAQDDPVSSR